MRFVIALLLLSFMTGCTVIGPGERGIRYTFGSASDEVVQPGPHLWIPFVLGMSSIDVQIQKSDVETSAASRDMQEITTHVAVNWSISADSVVKVFKQVGDEDDVLERIITPAVSEVLKSAAAKKTAEEILTQRLELKSEIDEQLKTRLAPYGVNVSDISIVNLTFSKEFTDAIERKQIAEQRAKEAAYDAQKATEDAKAAVEQAKGQAEAQRLVKQTITPEVLQMRAIEKWDGQFPQVMGQQTLPFLNLK